VKPLLLALKLLEKVSKIWEKQISKARWSSGEILKLDGETMTPYLARLLEITLKNATIPRDWKIAIMVHICNGVYRSALSNFRHIISTTLVCKQLEHVIAGYLRQLWDKSDWIYEGQHGFRKGHSCESQVIRMCQDIAKTLGEEVGIDMIIIDFTKAFDLVPHNQLLTNLATSGVDARVVVWVSEFLVDRTQSVRIGGQL